MKQPCVYLVGAGPGDPTLISVRGQRYLEAADVVIYDHRVHARLLRGARPDAERIDVGPAAPKPLEQDAICFLLAEKARDGKTVVRLKWGDPFVFDSGGKEALFLHEHGVPFEVVPGIPVSIGGPAYAGIPVTYPEAGDVLTVVRGYENESNITSNEEWRGLAAIAGSIVCYAGKRQVQAMSEALISHGRAPDESAALIYDATLPSQRTVEGTLETIAAAADADRPGLMVIGAVAGLRSHLRWFDNRPLSGRRIVVTRSREQATELIDMLEERGAEAIPAHAIRITAPEDSAPLENACRNAGSFDWIIFASANAVDSFMRGLLSSGDVRDLHGVKLCTVGPSTASRLQRYGIRVDLTPAEFRADSLADTLKASGSLTGQRILIPRANIARDRLAEELREAGAEVVDVVAYRTVPGGTERNGEYDVYRMLLDRQIDAVTFASASAVRNFVGMIGEDQAADLLKATVVASIGPVTAEAAQQLGLHTTVMPSRYTIPDLVDALVEHFSLPVRTS
ncbi:MAG TPA: uroporphyrinogen-III C-methyltransferase [Vicinamibacterales bacterium]|nr:uroporphyrinogen-III C-methyltransferase [Vicinamibacterales bacterium]